MNNATELKKKILIATANDITAICFPLFEECHLNYFHFRRTFKDGSFFWLGTNAGWQTNFLGKNIPVCTPPPPQKHIDKNFYLAPWEGNVEEKIMREARNDYDIDNGIVITEPYKNHFDSYSFASSHKTLHTVDFYLNNIDILRVFILYFKDKADALIKMAHENKIQRSPDLIDPTIEKILNCTCTHDEKRKLIEKLKPKKYTFNSDRGEYTLTLREFECFGYLNKGLSSKEIARILAISPRTVETYIENVKTKLGCNLKSELIDLWRANQLDFIFD